MAASANRGGSLERLDDLTKLRRFLCLGTETSCLCVCMEKEPRLEDARSVYRLIESGQGGLVVQEIKKFGLKSGSAKLKPLCFALALCAKSDDSATKRAAYEAFEVICTSSDHLLSFVKYCEDLSISGTGWGRAHRRAICNWYNSRSPFELAVAVGGCKNRGGWSHLDVMRLSHIRPTSEGTKCVCKYIAKGIKTCSAEYLDFVGDLKTNKTILAVLSYLNAVEDAKRTKSENDLVILISAHGLTQEHCPAELLHSSEVWMTLLQGMPVATMLKSLGKMSSYGVFCDASPQVELVCERLGDESCIQGIHPFDFLSALKLYERGRRGTMGVYSWEANPTLRLSLADAYHLSLKFVEPLQKRLLLAVDVSGSMNHAHVAGTSHLSPLLVSAAMVMVAIHSEDVCHVVAFSHHLTPLTGICRGTKLSEVCEIFRQVPMGKTDSAHPILYALQYRLQVDVFIICTDQVPGVGPVDPCEALVRYREQMGIDSRLVVCALSAKECSISGADDRGIIYLAGFNSSVPNIIRNFALGEI